MYYQLEGLGKSKSLGRRGTSWDPIGADRFERFYLNIESKMCREDFVDMNRKILQEHPPGK